MAVELPNVRLVFMNYKVRTGKVTQGWNLNVPEARNHCFLPRPVLSTLPSKQEHVPEIKG